MCPLWQCGTKTLVCTPQIKEIKTTTTTKHGSTTASFIHNSSCNQLLCHFILFSSVWNLACLAFENKQLSYLFWPPLTIIDSVWGRFLWGQGKNVTFSPNQKSSSFSKAYVLNLIVINIYFFNSKIFYLSLWSS